MMEPTLGAVPNRAPTRIGKLLLLGPLTVLALGLLEAAPVLLLAPAPLVERLETLSRLLLNYGLYGLAASCALAPVAWRSPSGVALSLAAIWALSAGGLFGDRLHEEWLRRVPAASVPGIAASVLLLAAAVWSAPHGSRLICRRPGAVLAWCLALGLLPLLLAPRPNPLPPIAAPPPAGAPNVVLILADTLRQDHLGHSGDPRGLSPHLDRLARHGVQLCNAYSTSNWTKPAVASLMTSKAPHVHGANSLYAVLPRRHTTLAEWLAAHGYRTGGFSTNRMVSALGGLDRGFQNYWNPRGHTLLSGTTLGRLGLRFPFLPVLGLERGTQSRRGETLNRQALQWLDAGAPRPFFLYLHYMETHSPYRPPPQVAGPTRTGLLELEAPLVTGPRPFVPSQRFGEDLESDYRLLYAASVRHLDALLGSMLGALQQRGLLRRSVVIVASDHGEELLDHGSWGHAHSLFEELVRVELLWSVAPTPSQVRLSRAPASLLDVFPTLCGLLSLPAPRGLAGLSLQPAFAGARLPERVLLFESLEPYRYRGLLRGGRKALRLDDWGEPVLQAYDLLRDPAEADPAAATLGASAELFQALAELASAPAVQELSGSAREELENELESLGYAR